jgi:hypothetical protein
MRSDEPNGRRDRDRGQREDDDPLQTTNSENAFIMSSGATSETSGVYRRLDSLFDGTAKRVYLSQIRPK